MLEKITTPEIEIEELSADEDMKGEWFSPVKRRKNRSALEIMRASERNPGGYGDGD